MTARTTPDPELARLVAKARAAERAARDELSARARLRELRATAASGEPLAQLGVRIPASLRGAVGDAARLAGTTTQEWVTRVLAEAVDRAADPVARAATRLAADLRARWQELATDDAYAAQIAALGDAELANV